MTAILYCLFVSVVILGQIFSAYKLIKAYTNGQVEANKLSLMTVAFCNIQDFFLTMMHLYFLMAQEVNICYIRSSTTSTSYSPYSCWSSSASCST